MLTRLQGVDKINQNSLESTILNRIISTGEIYILTTILIKRVDSSYFESMLHRSIFDYIYMYYQQYSSIPSIQAIESAYPDYSVSPIKDSITPLVDELIYRWTLKRGDELTMSIKEELLKGQNPLSLIKELSDVFSETRSIKKEGYFVSRSEEFVQKKIQAKEKGLEEQSLKVGIPYIDKEFGGIHPTDYIGILADEKKGKSWIMCYLAFELSKRGKNVLFISPEMDNDEVEERLHLLNTHYNSLDFFQGNLTPEQFTEWRGKNQKLKENLKRNQGGEVIIIDDIPLADFNITTIKTRLKKVDTHIKSLSIKAFPDKKEFFEEKSHMIDCIIIDGYHLLNGTDIRSKASEWKESQLVSQGLRSFARIEKVPLIVALHTNRDSQNNDEKIIPDHRDTSMTASLGRDLTLLISLFSTPTLESKKKLGMCSKLSRRSPKKVWSITFDPTQGIVGSQDDQVMTEKEFEDSLAQESLM